MSAQSITSLPIPRYRVGFVSPLPVNDYTAYTFYCLMPKHVMMASISSGLEAFSAEAVERAVERFWGCVERLTVKPVDVIVLGGVPLGAYLGREAADELNREVERRSGVPGLTDFHCVLRAMHHLGVKRVAVANKWHPELNQRVAAFLQSDGFEVVSATAEPQTAAEVQTITPEQGLEMALDLGRRALQKSPDADGLFLAGGAWLSSHAIPRLEAEFGKPVFVNLQSTVWAVQNLLGIWQPISGWGQLLASA
jgi:maleate cis-trans isomerase